MRAPGALPAPRGRPVRPVCSPRAPGVAHMLPARTKCYFKLKDDLFGIFSRYKRLVLNKMSLNKYEIILSASKVSHWTK